MPFLLYSTADADGSKTYEQLGPVPLAGNTNGLIRQALLDRGIRDVDWVLDRNDLLAAGGYDPATHAVVIDPTPARSDEVTLLEVMRVAGRSEFDWTPLMLVLEALVDESVEIETQAPRKRSFAIEPSYRERILTFLYLQGDHNGGSWNWGAVGRVNGPLLWPAAFAHFVSVANMK